MVRCCPKPLVIFPIIVYAEVLMLVLADRFHSDHLVSERTSLLGGQVISLVKPPVFGRSPPLLLYQKFRGEISCCRLMGASFAYFHWTELPLHHELASLLHRAALFYEKGGNRVHCLSFHPILYSDNRLLLGRPVALPAICFVIYATQLYHFASFQAKLVESDSVYLFRRLVHF